MLLIQGKNPCWSLQKLFRVPVTTKTDDNMLNIRRAMVDQGCDPFFKAADAEGIDDMDNLSVSCWGWIS